MASTYSALKIELIATGEQAGTWGATTNVNLGDAALGEAITGSADVAFSSADVTITLTDTNTTQAARNLRLNLTGTSGGARNLILGSGCQIEKLYLVNNGLADAVTVKNTTGTGIAVPAGKTMFVYNNGTNVVEAVNYAASISTGAITATSITNSGLTSGRVVYSTTGGLETDSANLTFNGTTLTANTIGAYTLSGTIAGGGNQINNVIIGTSTPLAGSFTTINASTSITNAGLTSGRVTYAGASGLLSDSANLTYDGTSLTTPRLVLGGTTLPSAGTATLFSRTSDNNTYLQTGSGNNFNLLDGSQNTMATFSPTVLNFNISNTERMRLNSTGLGIGTSSPRLSLDVSGSVLVGTYQTSTNYATLNVKPSSTITTPSTFTNAINIWNGTNVGEYSNITFGYNSTGLTNAPSYFGFVSTSSSGAGKGDFVFGTRDVTTDTAATERMRITSAGNVGIGTSSPAFKTEIVGGATTVETTLFQVRSDAGGIGTGSTIAFANSTNASAGSGRVEIAGIRDTSSGSSFVVRTADSGGTIQERMRIDSSGNLGVGETSPSSFGKLAVYGGSANTIVSIKTNSFDGTYYAGLNFSTGGQGANDPQAQIKAVGANNYSANLIFSTQNSGTTNPLGERMRITSAGLVGIGTSSPDSFTTFPSKLVVGSGSGGQSITIYSGTTGEGNLIFADGTTGTDQYRGLFRYDHADDSMKFYTGGGTLGMTQNASGNLGLGVTPSAWQVTSGSRAIQFTGSAVYGYRDTNLILTQNAYFDGGFKYYASSIASAYYGIGSGVHTWYTAPSGTAGNAVTFTQAMTLDASGGLQVLNTIGVGNTAPSTSGAGITFPATQSASSNANTLDDYEEGTWTPGVGNQTVVGTFSSSGTYTKIGRQVTVRGYATSTGTIAGAAGTYFDNLPFASATDFPGGIGTNDGGSFVRFFGLNASSNSLFIVNGYAAVTGVFFSCTYFV